MAVLVPHPLHAASALALPGHMHVIMLTLRPGAPCREVGVPLSRTFIINPKGQLVKASSTVQSSTWSSLSAINELVEEVFPYMEAGAPTSSLPPAEEAAVPAIPPAALAAAAADGTGAVPQPLQADAAPPQQQLTEGVQVAGSAAAATPAANAGERHSSSSSSSSSVGNGAAGERRMVTQDSRNDPDWAVLVGTGTVPFSSLPRGSDSSSRSSTDTAAVTAPPMAAAGAVATPSTAAAAAAGTGPGSGQDGLDAKGWPKAVAISVVAQGSGGLDAAAPAAAKTPAAALPAEKAPSGQSPPSTARASVGPAREEFNDNQFWRVTPVLAFNVEEELQQSMRRRSGGSSAGGALAGGASGFTTASSSINSSRRTSFAGGERGGSFGSNSHTA